MKKLKSALGVVCLVLGAGPADACTGMYAGKGVTADGTTMIGYFYPDYYVGQKGGAPLVHWDTLNIASLEIWLDGTCILMSKPAVPSNKGGTMR